MYLRDYSNRGLSGFTALASVFVLLGFFGVLPRDVASHKERVIEVVRLIPEVQPAPPPPRRGVEKEAPKQESTPALRELQETPREAPEVSLDALDALISMDLPSQSPSVPTLERRSSAKEPDLGVSKGSAGFEVLSEEPSEGSFALNLEGRSRANLQELKEGKLKLSDQTQRVATEAAERSAKVNLERREDFEQLVRTDKALWENTLQGAFSKSRKVVLPKAVVEHMGVLEGDIYYIRAAGRELYVVWDQRSQLLRVLALEGTEAVLIVGNMSGPTIYRKGKVVFRDKQPVAIETASLPPSQGASLYNEIIRILVKLSS